MPSEIGLRDREWLPQTWLLREGWKRYGPIGFREVPRSAVMREAA